MSIPDNTDFEYYSECIEMSIDTETPSISNVVTNAESRSEDTTESVVVEEMHSERPAIESNL